MEENIKEQLERANVELADLKHQLASKMEEKEVVTSDHLSALTKIQELEAINRDLRKEMDEKEERLSSIGKVHKEQVRELEEKLSNSKSELESLHLHKNGLEGQLEAMTARTIQQEETNEEVDAVTNLTKKINDNENKLTSIIEDSLLKVTKSKKEVDHLGAQYCKAQGSIACRSGDCFNQANVMKQELDSLRSQNAESEILLEKKSEEVSQYLVQVETLKEELSRKTSGEQITSEEKVGLRLQVMDLQSEVDTLIKQKNLSEDEVRSNICEINQLREERGDLQTRTLELKSLLEERELELSALQEDRKNKRVDGDEIMTLNEEVELLQQKLDSLNMEKSQLESQIAVQQRMKKERDETSNNKSLRQSSFKLSRRVSLGSHINHQILEKKMEDLATEFRKGVDDNIRILYQRIKVAEKIHFENKEAYKKTKEELEKKLVALEEKIASCEAELKLRDQMEIERNSRIELITDVNTLEDYGNSNATDEVVSANDFDTEISNESEPVTSNVDLLVAELKNENELLVAKLMKEEEENTNLMKAVNELENRTKILEGTVDEKDETLSSLQEEKREAIRQLCLLIDYHLDRSYYLKELISKLSVRNKRKT